MRFKLQIILLLLVFSTLMGCKISGKVTYDGEGLEGVTVTLTGDASKTTITNNKGRYAFNFLERGTYTVHASKICFEFIPESIDVDLRKIPVSGKNFEAELANIRVPEDYATIQEAIHAACNGHEILVADGIYTENVFVYKQLTIKSENGFGSTTVLAADPDDPVFHVSNDHVTIDGFTIYGEDWSEAGMYLDYANYCTISNNRCGYDSSHNNKWGIKLENSNNNAISNNICNSNEWDGIALTNSEENFLSENTCDSNDDGIGLWESFNNTIESNVCNSNDYWGIFVTRSSNNTISGNTCNLNYSGIKFKSNSNNDILNNICLENICGFDGSQQKDIALIGNTFSENYQGIHIYESSDDVISENICNSNYLGMFLSSMENGSIWNNQCLFNESDGIILTGLENNIFSGNICSQNSVGIRIQESKYNTLTRNISSENYIGIFISEPPISSHDNDIFLNDFINNTTDVYSYKTSANRWYSPTLLTYEYNELKQINFLGNFYSNHDLIDSDGDGITDDPYDLPGDEPDDEYPLVTTSDQFIIDAE